MAFVGVGTGSSEAAAKAVAEGGALTGVSGADEGAEARGEEEAGEAPTPMGVISWMACLLAGALRDGVDGSGGSDGAGAGCESRAAGPVCARFAGGLSPGCPSG